MLTREKIRAGWVREMVAANAQGVHVLTDEELRATQAACLARLGKGCDLWLFGYGSLIWNPCFEFAERRLARVHGWHRRFCLWTHLGRGSTERPGLMLGLERGGSCHGVVFRLPAETIETELDVVWRREMVTAAYVPTWVRAATEAGNVPAVAFTINCAHSRYAGRLDEAATVEALALAEGPLGTNREYLFNTVAHLEGLGLHDRALHRLAAAVRRRVGDQPPVTRLAEPSAPAHVTGR
jgi:cation transport protein ChaC